ncbi:Pyridoxamine 5'-phosphate oxidase [Paenibacillus konkukensis]|uniref:Pyridoxamine 5'-phosphate oxidase n=1 Tax=Paenibacillus konkukensis TaxID=2020716 RepID=A0ABY4RWG2_9BACL|nr:pyridoxamine 5'-phosphate oxidase family protein [Paenibacillus konkukensis]UQZ86568.1 Pyridoxamine 5'-phosphate oxidase [Paenibacillus konkukensis]
MRRNEFSVTEQNEIDDFLQEMSFGIMGTAGLDGWPHLTPINYAYHNGHIYIHGSRAGQKMKEIARHKQVSFAVAKEYAIIPSYFSDPQLACPATAYFKSVHIRGEAQPVDDPAEKAEALSALMKKLQPEGGYIPIDASDPLYQGELRAVSVVRIGILDLTAKFKFGQNLSGERRDKLEQDLLARGLPLDPETAELMRKYCPHHREEKS